MKRKIKFPLIMNKETSVRTIEELRGNFNIEETIEYFLSGKLQKWLRDRSYNNELEKILGLDINSKNFNKDLCLALDIDPKKYIHIDAKKIEEKKNRLSKIKKYTDEKSIIDKADEIIFTQEELSKKLNELSKANDSYENTKIYLCGDQFSIADNFEHITYIGVNKSTINIISTSEFDAKSKNIKFENLIITSKNKIDLKIEDYKLFEIDNDKINLKKCEGRYCKTYIKAINNYKYVLDSNGNLRKFSCRSNEEEMIFLPEFESQIVDIDSDEDCSTFIATDKNGKVYQWGDLPCLCKSIPNNLPKIVQVATDGEIFIGLDESGKLHWWGGFNSEYIFDGNTNYDGSKVYYIKKPDINSKIIQVACRGEVVMAVDENGKIYSWGRNYDSENQLHNIPKNLPPIKKIALYRNFVFALDKNGKIHFWGQKEYGNYNIPKDIPKIADITDCNQYPYSALGEDGKIHIWGDYKDQYKKDIEKLPNLTCLVDIGGIDEQGNFYGKYYKEGLYKHIGKISENIKAMIPIR